MTGLLARFGLKGGQTAGRTLLTRFSGSTGSQGIRSIVQTLTANPLRALGVGAVSGSVATNIPVMGDMLPGGGSNQQSFALGAVAVVAAIIAGAFLLR